MRYPSNEVTPHGWYQILKGNQPMMWLDAYDQSIRFDLLGGLSIPDRYAAPEGVQIPRDGLKGLIPPWRHIDQKGSTQDGVTHIDALIDPNEIELKLVCRGRDGKRTREVVRAVVDSLDAKHESRLNFLTQDMGHWWADVRWFKGAPPDPLQGAQNNRQTLSLRLRGDRGLWRTYDNSDQFAFEYESMIDTFTEDYTATADLGPLWPQYYSGAGGGYCSTTPASSRHKQARWYESGKVERTVVNGPYKDFATDTDYQVVTMVLGSMPQVTFNGGAFNDLWARMGRNPDGTWNGYGVRARVGIQGFFGWVELSRFNNFVRTPMASKVVFFPPLYGEKFTLIAGVEGDPRMFRIQRNGVSLLSHKEKGDGSPLGSAYRGVGFGMHADGGPFNQASPGWVRKISAGDNATVKQSGFLKRANVGDQPMYDDYICFGPGIFRIWDGPAADDYVEFGKLLPNQVVLLRTDPRDRNVYDLTTIPPSPQELTVFQKALKQFLSFAFANNVPPLVESIQSTFGIRAPQGNMYSLLKGRFTDRAAIPAKSPGNKAQPYFVKCEIDEGNADSKIIASGTPLRRYPL